MTGRWSTTLRCCLPVLAWLVASHAVHVRAQEPVKVFILAGQSNMVGAGQIAANRDRNEGRGSLEWLVADAPDSENYRHLIDESGDWVTRDDVGIWYLGRTGGLAPGYGSNESTIGPELGFGSVVGQSIDQPVLLIKLAWGGKSLGVDFRPPSAGGDVGPYYREVVEQSKDVLARAGELFPEWADREFELCGFGWHQGWNDRVNQALNDQYEENMVHFIHDIRREFDAPHLPFVIAETGMSGHEETHPRALSLMAAQAAVAEREEFRGNVAFVGTKDFYRPADQSPSGQAYHWNNNAETYYLIGAGMGEAMLGLMKEQAAAR